MYVALGTIALACTLLAAYLAYVVGTWSVDREDQTDTFTEEEDQ